MSDNDLPNIIAVDDDYAVRMGMEFMFKKWPEYNLILAEDPDDALAKLDEREYMMMFSDINMPVMSGFLIQRILILYLFGNRERLEQAIKHTLL